MFYFNKGSINLGDEWQDHSLITLAADTQSVAITYNKKIPYGMTFDEFCEKEITDLGGTLPKYEELSRENLIVSGANSVLTEFKWVSPKGKFHQMTLIVDMVDRFPVVITCTNVGDMSENQKKRFLSILKTFKIKS